MATPVRAWLEERLPLSDLTETLRHKTVPYHRYSIWYYFGGMTLFLFGIQVGTGALLLLYYRPSASEAYESVQFIMARVPFGWLIRSVHAWSANLMVACAVAHLFSVLFLHAYRRPRELTWISGVVLLLLTLGFGFTGYLLPWNEVSFFATRVGTDIAATVPVIGHGLVRFCEAGMACRRHADAPVWFRRDTSAIAWPDRSAPSAHPAPRHERPAVDRTPRGGRPPRRPCHAIRAAFRAARSLCMDDRARAAVGLNLYRGSSAKAGPFAP
jgi:hypothetical protein